MNDPGFDEPINDVNDIERQREDEHEEEEEEEQAFLAPSRWWFASTAFPLIAGTFGPMASAFSVCALVVHWRVFIPPGAAEQNGIPLPDPKWLIGINAAQLVIAIVSNLFLLANMARRVRFVIAQPITIIGWYLSSFALVGLIACASGPLVIEPRSNHAFTQAYYYAIFAAGLYFIVATLMLVTVWGAYRGHYDKDFELTMSQRTLMLQTISFLVYLLAGAAVYSHIEGWAFLDSVYWADFTLLTIGIGDYSPATHLGRGLLFPFAIGGIIIIGLVIGSIRSLVLERGKMKLGARMVEKERQRLLVKTQKKNGEVLEPVTDDSGRMSRTSTKTLQDNKDQLTERERRKHEFELMRTIQERAATRRRWMSLAVSGTTWLGLWFIGAAIFQKTEYGQDWTYFGSLYFAYTSLLTIGYGDFYPQSNSGKPFFVFWSLLAIPSLTILISNMGDTVVKVIRDLTLWIGNFTVLPDEKGIKANIKESTYKLTRGRLFNDDVEEAPPGILGDSKKQKRPAWEDGHKNDPDSAAQRVAGDKADTEVKKAEKKGEGDDELPKSKRHYHVVLIKEISKVMKHLNSTPPRKYTFDEWAWYLKLIGEDENSVDTHRKALKKPKADGEGLGNVMKGEDGKAGKQMKWSWVGNRSPLMGNKEEAEWVLERLTRTLSRELEEIRKEEIEGTRDWTKDGKMGKERGAQKEGEGKDGRKKEKNGRDEQNEKEGREGIGEVQNDKPAGRSEGEQEQVEKNTDA